MQQSLVSIYEFNSKENNKDLILGKWVTFLGALYEKHHFTAEEVYNMDETGFQLDPIKS